MTVNFSSETMRPEGDILQALKEKNSLPKKLSTKNEEQIKVFSDERKLRKFINSNPTLKEWLKEILWVTNQYSRLPPQKSRKRRAK